MMRNTAARRLAVYISVAVLLFLEFILAIGMRSSDVGVALETDPNVLRANSRSDSFMDEELEQLGNSIDAYGMIWKTFGHTDQQHGNDDVYTVSGIPANGFPKAYAGAYINANLDLVVMLTESELSSGSARDFVRTVSRVAGDTEVIYTSASYSYAELVSIMDEIYQYVLRVDVSEEETEGFAVRTWSIAEIQNCVVVGLADTSDECIAAFRKAVSSSNAIIFEIGETPVDT